MTLLHIYVVALYCIFYVWAHPRCDPEMCMNDGGEALKDHLGTWGERPSYVSLSWIREKWFKKGKTEGYATFLTESQWFKTTIWGFPAAHDQTAPGPISLCQTPCKYTDVGVYCDRWTRENESRQGGTMPCSYQHFLHEFPMVNRNGYRYCMEYPEDTWMNKAWCYSEGRMHWDYTAWPICLSSGKPAAKGATAIVCILGAAPSEISKWDGWVIEGPQDKEDERLWNDEDLFQQALLIKKWRNDAHFNEWRTPEMILRDRGFPQEMIQRRCRTPTNMWNGHACVPIPITTEPPTTTLEPFVTTEAYTGSPTTPSPETYCQLDDADTWSERKQVEAFNQCVMSGGHVLNAEHFNAGTHYLTGKRLFFQEPVGNPTRCNLYTGPTSCSDNRKEARNLSMFNNDGMCDVYTRVDLEGIFWCNYTNGEEHRTHNPVCLKDHRMCRVSSLANGTIYHHEPSPVQVRDKRRLLQDLMTPFNKRDMCGPRAWPRSDQSCAVLNPNDEGDVNSARSFDLCVMEKGQRVHSTPSWTSNSTLFLSADKNSDRVCTKHPIQRNGRWVCYDNQGVEFTVALVGRCNTTDVCRSLIMHRMGTSECLCSTQWQPMHVPYCSSSRLKCVQ